MADQAISYREGSGSIIDTLVGSKFVGTELVGTLAKILGEVGHDPQVIARADLRVVATMEFLQHHLA